LPLWGIDESEDGTGAKMAETNMRVVREFLEANNFTVITNRKFQIQKAEPPGRYSIDLLGRNMDCREPDTELPMRLQADQIRNIPNLIVDVKGWHSHRFSPTTVSSMRELYYFVSPEALEFARSAFGDAPFKSVLVISEAPVAESARSQMEEVLKKNGIDHFLEFPTILSYLIAHVEVSVNYTGSDILQLLRFLKRYGLVRGLQFELPFKRKPGGQGSKE
jgi:hypothetical protein